MAIRNSDIVAGYTLSGVIAVTATVLMLMPDSPGPPAPFVGLDKIAHAMTFFLVLIPILSVRPAAWIWLVPLAAAYGGVIELIQPFFGRGRELGDFIANIVGITLAIPVGRVLHRRFSKRRKAQQGEGPQRQD